MTRPTKKPKAAPKPKPKVIGRPSKYDINLAATICGRLAGGESLKAICSDEDMPKRSTVYLWRYEHPEFSDMYARAREDQADTLADEIMEIADDGTNDFIKNKDGVDVLNSEHVQRSRLRVDARKWIASKLKPRSYGDKVQAEVTGAEGGPLQVSWLASEK
jgi:hypothetical protein